MKRLACFLLMIAVVVPAGLALQAQESDPKREGAPTGVKLDELIDTLRQALAEAEGKPSRQPIRFELRIYDVRDLTYPIRDYPGTSINLVPSGGFGFGAFEDEEAEPVVSYEGDAIADMIRDTIAPGSWGELRSVDVQYRSGGRLLVRHTPAVHDMIAELLGEIRSRTASQITLKVRLVRTKDAVMREVLGADSAFVLTEEAEARLSAAILRGRAELVHEGSISCTNTQRVALTEFIQESYLQDYDVEIAEGSAIADPIVQSILDGYVVDVRPVVAGAGDLLILQVRAEVSRLTRPIQAVQMPLGRIETPELSFTKLRTTVALAIGRSAVVGGALGDGDEGALMLLVTPVATRYGGR